MAEDPPSPTDATLAAPAKSQPTVATLAPSSPLALTPTEAATGDGLPVTIRPLGGPAPMPADWRYTLGAEIARGGMGRVVEATDAVLGRTVALKEALSSDADAIRRFHRETRITARLEHPSIVPVHDAGTSPTGSPFYVMRKISGRPLEQLVAGAETIEDRLALLPHVVAAANAIAHAHGRGIVHRDIKPANILVGGHGETVVIDWGLAKALDEPSDDDTATTTVAGDDDELMTRAGSVFGTPGFMAPEQLRGSPADKRADVYALGATLYYLLARRVPHHSKRAIDMMEAALAGPPDPIGGLVDGLPPELSTIVDKALAHDAKARYADAGALAEDLQRFLTGQLVASHHYSTRERIFRFIRRNRAPVAIAAIAVVALAVGARIAIGRIVDERELAVAQQHVAEHERAEANRRSDELTLKEATSEASQDPTLAVALVKRLATGDRWREVRAIAQAARQHGVAFTIPASPHTLSIALLGDRRSAVTAGDDGVVRVVDLASRTSRVLAELGGPVRAVLADGERLAVAFRDRTISVIPVAGGRARVISAPTPIKQLQAVGTALYWLDIDGAVYAQALATATPTRVALPEPVAVIAPSPDGAWLLIGGTHHVWLLSTAHLEIIPEPAFSGLCKGLAWATDSVRAVMLLDDELDQVLVDRGYMHLLQRDLVGRQYACLAVGSTEVAAGPLGVQFKSNTRAGTKPFSDTSLGLFETTAQRFVTGGVHGAIAVYSATEDDRMLQSPVPSLALLAAAPTSPWIVAAADGRLIAWDFDAIAPHEVGRADATGVAFVGNHHLVATFENLKSEWIDLGDVANPKPLEDLVESLLTVASSADGQLALVVDGTHRAQLVAATGDSLAIEGDVDVARALDGHRFAFARPNGEIAIIDLPAPPGRDQRHITPIHPAGARPIAFAASGRWVAAAFADHELWRYDVERGEATRLSLTVTPDAAFELTGDGTIVFADGDELFALPPHGMPAAIATLPAPAARLVVLDADRAIAIAANGDAWTVALAGHSPPVAHRTPIPPNAGFSTGTGLFVASSTARDIEVIDPIADLAWPLGSLHVSRFAISPDGQVVAGAGPHGISTWPLEVPDRPRLTTWLGQLTNATAASGPGSLTWR